MNPLKQKILNCLKQSLVPLDVETIRTTCSIGHWNTALKHCLELLIEDQIYGLKTSRGWIFWLNNKHNKKEANQ